jgi:F420H(2)-dependent quinone reductase
MANEFDYVKTRREDVKAISAKVEARIAPLLRLATRMNVYVFKKSRGRLMKTFIGGAPISVVTTTGARSGKKREVALIDINWGEKKLLVASKGGMSKHPFWYYNIKANPEVEIMAGGKVAKYRAEQASDEEKREVWPVLLGVYPDFDEYQARTDRNIPVFICSPLVEG